MKRVETSWVNKTKLETGGVMKASIFSKRLTLRRKELGLEQSELAEATGLSTNTISNYETGNREPKLKTLVVLAKKLKCSTDWLLGAGKKPLEPTQDIPSWILPLAPQLELIKTKAGRNHVRFIVNTISKTKADWEFNS
jgi:transcriptional regulator with XRE-family HTH domain